MHDIFSKRHKVSRTPSRLLARYMDNKGRKLSS